MNICVIGNSNNLAVTPKTKEFANVVISHILKVNANFSSGGCNGIIEYINEELCNLGKKVTYYSPATSKQLHNEIYNLKEHSNIEYILEENDKSLSYNFLNRSLKMIDNCDIVICFYGTWGTLSELSFAVMLGKKIIFACEDDKTLMIATYKNITALNQYDYNEKVYFANSPNQLKIFLEELND